MLPNKTGEFRAELGVPLGIARPKLETSVGTHSGHLAEAGNLIRDTRDTRLKLETSFETHSGYPAEAGDPHSGQVEAKVSVPSFGR